MGYINVCKRCKKDRVRKQNHFFSMSQNAKKNISRSMETENEDLVSIRYQPFIECVI